MRNRCAIASIAAAVLAMVLCATAAAAVRTSQSGWTWGNPRPQGHELRAVDFSGGRGYAVGDFGTILRTDDGGTSWSGVRTGLTDDLSKLRVLDANTFVAGGGCTLLRSNDGGMTLRRLSFNPSANCGSPLSAMHFPTRDVGFLVRADGSVLRTEDGGARYSSRTALPGTGGGPPNDIWFTSEDSGVVATGSDTLGKVFRTTNGGESWNEVATSGALRGLFFVSATTGYAVGQTQVLKTTDGGASWNPVAAASSPLRSIRCADEDHCVMVAGNGFLMYTDDGFDTLETSGYEPPPGGAVPLVPVPALAASFNSATRVAAVGRRGDDAISENAGRTFTPTGVELQGSYSRLRLTSPSTVFAPGSGGSVARSTDTGATWARVGVPTTNDIVDVAFPSASLGYAVDEQGAVFRTDNGGASWAILGDVGSRPSSITASADGDVVLLIGPRGIMRSANGGANFDPVEAAAAGPRVALDDVDRTSDGVTYVFGSKAIALSSDEGARWTAVKRPSRSSIIDVDFVDRRTGYVLTGDRRVWFTNNRGARWRELLTVGGDSPYSIAFGDRNNGYVAVTGWAGNGDGWLLRTSDGGASWRPQLLSTASAANRFALVATGTDIAHVLSGSSDLFSTSTGGDAATSSTLTLSTKTRRLRRRGKVRVDGRVAPAAPGAEVEVAVRELGSNRWTRQIAQVRSDGTFSTSWTVRRTSSFVARWAGNQELNGDGSPALRVTVGR